MSRISAVIIVKNGASTIARAVRSAAFCDECIVVDSGSSDGTADIARAAGAAVTARPFDDFASQKNFAVSRASGDWVLSLDADETVAPELAEEIRAVLQRGDRTAAYAIRRKTRLFGKVMRFGGLQHDAPTRLFKKSKARFEGIVHERVLVDGPVGRLRNTLEHASFQTVGEYWDRLQRYTTLEAQQALEADRASAAGPAAPARSGGAGKYFFRPAGRFFKMYFLQQGFRDGAEGFVFAALSAYYEFVKWCKIDERRRLELEPSGPKGGL